MLAPVTFSPAGTYDEALHRAALMYGIQTDFWDIFGTHHVASPEAQRAILQSLHVPCATQEQLNQAIAGRLWRDWSRLLPQTLVVTASDEVTVPLSLPAAWEGVQAAVEIRLETGLMERSRVHASDLPELETAELQGTRFRRVALPLPTRLPLGYHTLTVTVTAGAQSQRAEAYLIVCPDRAYEPSCVAGGGQTAGVAVSLYGLRSTRNWGCGDTTDLTAFVDWVADEVKGSFVALNPLHAIPNRTPYNTSPYLPTCSFYRNFIYLDLEQIPEFKNSPRARQCFESPRLQAEIAELRAAPYVEYERVARLKLRFLKLLFRHFFEHEYMPRTARGRAFQEFIDQEGRLLRLYALHMTLEDAMHRRDRNVWNWHAWPSEYQDPESPTTQAFATQHWRSLLFYQYIQFELDRQFAAVQDHAKERGLPIGLYHDLALATDRFGGDLWAHRQFYSAGCRVGAPPDDFSPKGQDWSFPPPNSLAHYADGYRLFRESIRKNCRHGGALRIDHVMRFFRLFWIPDGLDPTQGVYVQDYAEDLLRILALESVRHKVVIIGEDLGTVEPHVRETLARFGVLSYRLLYFEKDKQGRFKRPDEYPRHALVSVSTHDLPTLAGFWTNNDIEARRQAGLLPDDGTYRRMLAERAQDKQKLLDFLHSLHLLPAHVPHKASDIPEFSGELHWAVVGFLVSTPSELMVLNQEDLFKDPDQQNLPGSTAEYPNWRHKMRLTIEELRTEKARGYTQMFRDWLVRSHRALPER